MAGADPITGQTTNPHSYLNWAKSIMTSLGNSDSPNSEIALVCWMVAEGSTRGGGSNPLNTKEPWPRAKKLPNGVYAYDNDNDGLAATVKTLKNGYYDQIVFGLTNDVPYVTTCRYVDTSVWGTHGATPIAVSVQASGGGASALYKQYAARTVPTQGHSTLNALPGVGAVTSTYDAVTQGFGAVGDFLGTITDPHNWYRAGQVIFGALCIFIGMFMLARGSLAGKLAGSAGSAVAGKVHTPHIGSTFTTEATPGGLAANKPAVTPKPKPAIPKPEVAVA